MGCRKREALAVARVGAGLLVGMLATGCAAPAVRTYTALRAYWPGELHAGEPFRDFAFTDAAGSLTRLSAIHGRVTVLAFSADPDWPDAEEERWLAEMAGHESACDIDVLVVSVGHPRAPCAEALAPAAQWNLDTDHLVLVCDPFGTVAPLYGPAAEGCYYVLTNFLQIAAIGELSDREGLDAATRQEVDRIYDLDLRMGRRHWFGW